MSLFRHILLITFLCGACFSAAAQSTSKRLKLQVGSDGSARYEYREVYEYDVVWEKPEFPGGEVALMQFINKNREYPEAAYRAGIQGRVLCSFIVNTNGTVSDVCVFRGVEESLNREAVRIFRLMPKWVPGRMNGIAVPVRVIRPVPFRR